MNTPSMFQAIFTPCIAIFNPPLHIYEVSERETVILGKCLSQLLYFCPPPASTVSFATNIFENARVYLPDTAFSRSSLIASPLSSAVSLMSAVFWSISSVTRRGPYPGVTISRTTGFGCYSLECVGELHGRSLC